MRKASKEERKKRAKKAKEELIKETPFYLRPFVRKIAKKVGGTEDRKSATKVVKPEEPAVEKVEKEEKANEIERKKDEIIGAKTKPEKLDRDTLKRRVKKKIRIGYWIGLALIILGIFVSGGGSPGGGAVLWVIAIAGMIIWKFIHHFFWVKFGGNTLTCYECKTEIDLVDRWNCPNCDDITRRHIISKCPSCGAYAENFHCPSCEATLDVYPKK